MVRYPYKEPGANWTHSVLRSPTRVALTVRVLGGYSRARHPSGIQINGSWVATILPLTLP